MALLLTNIRYWTSVAPVVRTQLRRWEQRAQAIPDPELRTLALEKLHGESFNAEAGAMLATFVPRARRREVVEAIVALELLFDYLDGLTERPSDDPLEEGRRLFGAYLSAVAGGERDGKPGGEVPPVGDHRRDVDKHAPQSHSKSEDYLWELSDAVQAALAPLEATEAIAEVARESAARAAQAQIRMHAAPRLGSAQLEGWARAEAASTGRRWRETLAGAASSVLVLHALIAAAADPRTTAKDAIELADAYLSICAVLTLLDGVVDRERDAVADRYGYVDLYEDDESLAQTLAATTRLALEQARELRDGPRHVLMLEGVVAYYASGPGAHSAFARPIFERLQHELRPSIAPTLAVLRTWRFVRRVRSCSPGIEGGLR
jgi:tetraprenyl-beta-curcumene synthase